MSDYAALPVKQEPPAFLYHKHGDCRYIDLGGHVWFEGFDVPKGYRFQATKWSVQTGDVEVYEKVSE